MWQIILIPVGLIVVGFVRQILALQKWSHNLNLAEKFLATFWEWNNERAKDNSLYNWMLDRSDAVQNMLGAGGLFSFCPPFESCYHRNVPIILNAIPAIQSAWRDDSGDPQDIDFFTQTVDSSLRRFIGVAKDKRDKERRRLFNPLVVFCGGVAWLLELPLFILSESNAIKASTRQSIEHGRVFNLVKFVGVVAALILTVMNIILNWNKLS